MGGRLYEKFKLSMHTFMQARTHTNHKCQSAVGSFQLNDGLLMFQFLHAIFEQKRHGQMIA